MNTELQKPYTEF